MLFSFRHSWLLPALVFLLAPRILCAQTGTITGKIASNEGKPLAYASVMLMGTTSGAVAGADGTYQLTVLAGSYRAKVSMMGYQMADRKIEVTAGAVVRADFRLEPASILIHEIIVVGRPPLVKVEDSNVTFGVTGAQLKEMPLDTAVKAAILKPGIVSMGDQIFAQGSRPDETKILYNGIPIANPLQKGTVDLAVLGTAGSDVTVGAMDPEFGDAQAAIINIATREGSEKFKGEVRYFTDDFGRSDKTYTNLDRFGVAVGGPTWAKGLRYFMSGEGTWSDTENPTIEPRPEHKLTDFLKFRERQAAAYNMQGKLTYQRPSGVKLDGEAVYSTSRSDQFINNWNVSGYVGKVWYFQELVYAIAPEPGQTEVMEFGRVRVFDHGPWADIKDAATRERRLHIRPVIVQSLERRPDGTQETVTYADFRAADLRIGNAVVTVVWDEALRSADGTVTGYKPWPLFEGFQRQLSGFKPYLQDAAGADSSFVPFNSATHTPETRSDNLQLKVGFTHVISSLLNYSIDVSRLNLHTRATVLDEHGDPKSPAEFSTAGLPVTLPNGTVLTGGITTPTWYTDDSVPYLVTAYDYPLYTDQHSVQWLMRGDVTSATHGGHRVKSGVQVIYNDLMNDERVFPGQQRVNNVTGVVQQGLDVNLYRSFNTEGAAYVQDKWEHEGMVVNGGVRFEWLTVGNNDEILIRNAEIDPRVQTFKSNVSPRLGVAFPITDHDKFFFHYGRFTQWPGRVYLFHSQDAVGTTGTLGNPNLEPELTVSYQAGISHQFSDDIAANFVVFNKDIYGLISSTQVTDDSTGVNSLRYINRTYASSRGLEISLEKRLTRRMGFELYYTYSFADGVASNADFGRSAAGLTHLPTDERPLDWDQRHTFNVTLRLADRNQWGATAIYSYGSGLPWTPIDRFARTQDPALENSRRLEPTHRLSLQGRKQFGIYGRQLTLFFEGRNLLDDDLLLPGGTAPAAFPNLEAATTDGGSYLTETGHYGGAYLQDNNDDGENEFYAVHDPTIWEQHRQWRLGLGFEF
jgi:outer membrane receptor protein involved in Fe transport